MELRSILFVTSRLYGSGRFLPPVGFACLFQRTPHGTTYAKVLWFNYDSDNQIADDSGLDDEEPINYERPTDRRRVKNAKHIRQANRNLRAECSHFAADTGRKTRSAASRSTRNL